MGTNLSLRNDRDQHRSKIDISPSLTTHGAWWLCRDNRDSRATPSPGVDRTSGLTQLIRHRLCLRENRQKLLPRLPV
jgi:hypothetical protein